MSDTDKIYQQDRNDNLDDHLPRWIKALLLLIPALIYLPGIAGRIPFGSESALYSDLMLSHYPNALYLKQSILDFHQIPLWSTIIHSGAPFAANPLAGLFYLPGWLALIFPLPEGISFLVAIHAVWGSMGMYRLLKNYGRNSYSALIGGLIFGLMPKIAAHYGAGHVTLIYAVSWTPWLFLVSAKDRTGWKTGIVAAILFLADPRWAFFAGIFWFTLDIKERGFDPFWINAAYYLRSGLMAVLIAAPLLFPLLEYVSLSTRSIMDIGDIFAFSLPPENIIGLLIPARGNPEWFIYSGGAVFGIFILQLFESKLRRANRFWNLWIIAALVVAIGSNLIDLIWLDRVPVISLLRVPSRILLLMGFCMAFIATDVIDFIAAGQYNPEKISKISFGLSLFAVIMAGAFAIITGELSINVYWGFAFLALFSLVLIAIPPKTTVGFRYLILAVIILVDLLGAGVQSFIFKEADISENKEVISFLDKDQELFRVYSPSYSLSQDKAVANGIQLADGVDPMQISAYSEYMTDASGVDDEGYSVTIPAFATGNPFVDNEHAEPDLFLLGLLNVKYVISEFEISSIDLQRQNTTNYPFIYLNTINLPRAWVELGPLNRIGEIKSEIKPVEIVQYTPNVIALKADGPGKLVLSEINYPGWKVSINGNQDSINAAYGILRSVHLDEGSHMVQFEFKPTGVFAGIGLAMAGWMIGIFQIRKQQDERLSN